jgi:serine/threonine protein kinase
MLSGRFPFDGGNNLSQTIRLVREGRYEMDQRIAVGAARLIKHLLTVDPNQRYTIDQILQHPWFTTCQAELNLTGMPMSSNHNLLLPLDVSSQLDETVRSISVQNIRLNVVAELTNLGYGTEEEIIGKLTAPEQCTVKVFYHLLCKVPTLPLMAGRNNESRQ